MLAALALAGCVPELVEWEEVTPVRESVEPAVRLRLADNGTPVFLADPEVDISAEGACPGSVVFAQGDGDEWYAAWWAPADAGTVLLMTSRSDDGGSTWSAPLVADGRDRGARGCDRTAPGIAADPAGGYVHIAYFLEPRGEAGVWYTHSMERGTMWHEPVAVMFGADPSRASVAANADTVVVAFEHPNAAEGRIGLAVSRTAGHIIEGRTVASVGSGYARDPRVAVRGREVAVAWYVGGPGVDAAEHLVVRKGELRPLPRRAR